MAQGWEALQPEVPRERDDLLAENLTSCQAAAFRALPAFHQRHLCRVYRLLQREGVADPDLLKAGLLHDLGQAADGKVRLPDRVALVLLRRLAPRLLRRLARRPASGWRRGLALAEHHAALGAELAASLGCPPRVCWLIRHHEDEALARHDRDLSVLMAADREVERLEWQERPDG